MRLFLATELPDPIKEKLVEFQRFMQENAYSARWVKADNFHLTLAFLGEVEEGDIDEYVDVITDAASTFKSFTLQVGAPGCFSSRGDARVVWTALEGDVKAMREMQSALASALGRLGYFEDKPFAAHLTLGREGKGVDLFRSLASGWKWGSEMVFDVDRIVLFSSKLLPGGPRYSEVASINLIKR